MTLVKWTNNPLINEMFNGMPHRPMQGGCDYNRPAANIIHNEKDFQIELAAPGMNKADFKIKIEDDILTISVERKEMKEETPDVNYTRREFRYDGFSRSFNLPEIIDQDKIKAEYKNGLLNVVLPKGEEAKIKGREIKIS